MNVALQRMLLAASIFAAPLAGAQSNSISIRVDGVSTAGVQSVARVLQARADELRSNWLGSTNAKAESSIVVVAFSGWAPKTRQVEALLTSQRSLKFVVEPSETDVLLTEADVADARPGIRGQPELAIRLNEGGEVKLRARSKSLVGKVISVYWDGRLISRPRVGGDLVRDIAITVPTFEQAEAISISLHAGPLPAGAILKVVR